MQFRIHSDKYLFVCHFCYIFLCYGNFFVAIIQINFVWVKYIICAARWQTTVIKISHFCFFTHFYRRCSSSDCREIHFAKANSGNDKSFQLKLKNGWKKKIYEKRARSRIHPFKCTLKRNFHINAIAFFPCCCCSYDVDSKH